jgi:hypothetical protein
MRKVRHDSGFEPPEDPREWGGGGTDEPSDNNWDLSEGLDPEGPSASDLDRFGSELDKCPNCESTIYDQSEMCPECGWYLGELEKSVSIWVVAGIVGLIVILLFWAF